MERALEYMVPNESLCALPHMIRGVHSSVPHGSSHHWGRRAFALTLHGSLLLPPLGSWAQSTEASCEAVEQTETLRAEGQYRQARERLLECVNAQCGGDVRRR